MCLRGFVVLFLGLVFLLPVASLLSLAPSSSIVPIACASFLPAAHVQNASLEKPALCSAASAPRASVPLLMMAEKRVCTRARIQIQTATLSLAGSGNADIGTTSPQNKLDVYGGVAIGTSYAGVSTAPTNGLLVQGTAGFGTASPGIGATIAPKVDVATNGASFVRVWSADNTGNAGVEFQGAGDRGSIYADANYNIYIEPNAQYGNGNVILKSKNGTGNVGHSDNRPGFRDAQIEHGSREEGARHDGLRTPENGRRNPVIERRSASTPSRFGYCFGAIPPHCGPVVRAS